MSQLALWEVLLSCHFVFNFFDFEQTYFPFSFFIFFFSSQIHKLIFCFFFQVGVIGALVTSSLKGSELFVPKTWRMLGFDGPPTSNERPSQAPESESESDRKKNLMAALKCDEEEVEKIQAQLLPLRNLPADANHL